jgi:SPP1 family predicted phage head-tail adaptor
MRAGALRHKITIQSPTITKTSGVSTTTWAAAFPTTFPTVDASIEMLKGFDKANAQASWPGADFTIGIRYIPGVTTIMRIVDEAGMIYSILGQPEDVDKRHREIVLTCESGEKNS